jgi:hypothetical protein
MNRFGNSSLIGAQRIGNGRTSPWQETQSGSIVVGQWAVDSVEGVDPVDTGTKARDDE